MAKQYYMENEDQLYRGPAICFVEERFDEVSGKWEAYKGQKSKPGHWGRNLDESEVKAIWPAAI